MKTPDEWAMRYWKLRDGQQDIHHEKNKYNWDKLVKEIQVEAFNEGVDAAAHEACELDPSGTIIESTSFDELKMKYDS